MAVLRKVIVFVIGALAGVALGACGPAPAVPAPEGFAVYESRNFPFAFAYPQDWELGSQPGESLIALGETGEGGFRQTAALKIDTTFSGDFDSAIDSLNQLATIDVDDLRVLEDEKIDVSGAKEARLVTSTYLNPGAVTAGAVRARQFDLFALAPDETLYYLRVGSPEALWEEERFRTIIDSFTLTG